MLTLICLLATALTMAPWAALAHSAVNSPCW